MIEGNRFAMSRGAEIRPKCSRRTLVDPTRAIRAHGGHSAGRRGAFLPVNGPRGRFPAPGALGRATGPEIPKMTVSGHRGRGSAQRTRPTQPWGVS